MASMVRRASHGPRDEHEDTAPPVLPKQSLWAKAAELGGAGPSGGLYAPVGQDDAAWGSRRRSYAELGVVGGGSPRLVVNSLRGPPYHCPDPRIPRPTAAISSRYFSAPLTLPSASLNFSLSLSYSTNICNAFDLVVSRTSSEHCQNMESSINPADDNPQLEKWIRGNLGPDSFLVQVEGAERIAFETASQYLGDCNYLYQVRANNAGRMWLNVTQTYEDYNAFLEGDFAEQSRPQPPLLMRPITPSPLELDLCSSQCTPFVPLRLGPPSSIPAMIRPSSSVSSLSHLFSAFFTSSSPRTTEETSVALPSCHDVDDPVDGSYIPSNPLDLIHPRYPVPLDHRYTRPVAGLSTFIPSGCQYTHAGQRFRDHTACITKKHNAFLMGDSHARGLLDIVAHRLEGNDSVVEGSPKALSRKAHVGNLFMIAYTLSRFFRDPFLTAEPACDYISKFDSIAISTGTHQICWNCPRTSTLLRSLTKTLTTWPRLIRSCHALRSSHKNPTLIFLTMPSFHPQLHNHDCRTGPRLEYTNERIKEVAEENGWEVVEVGKRVRPVAVDQIVGDGVHYLRLDAAEPIADAYIDLIGICDEE
ncbi:hypothetical protein JCM11641_004088 [Rhodosporidiobolus odoratus]